MEPICRTTTELFPHHYQCIYLDGHPGCKCTPDDTDFCEAFDCTLKDGARREPDASIYTHQ